MSFAARPIGLRVGAFVFTPTISTDTSNYNLKAAAIAAGWDQVTPLLATVTVDAGIVLSATATSGYGFDTGATFPAGTVLTLICQGYICGMGGAGGSGSGSPGGQKPAGIGGPALRAQYPISIDAAGGVIAGGGGGGGGDASNAGNYDGGGGGGRTGRTNSAAGYGANQGTFTKGGDGKDGWGIGGTTGPGTYTGTGPNWFGGGGGGGWGAAGGGPGNAAGGAAVVGNSYITWINTGTRYGAIT